MAARTKIEWTYTTWNPLTGCTKISEGCRHCYAERMAKRLQGVGQPKYRNGFALTLHEEVLQKPLSWKRPCRIFVNSMSDLFHEDVPLEFIQRVFEVIRATPQHVYQILTKRAERLAELSPGIDWPPNVWMGVTVERADYAYRIDLLRGTGARIKYVCMEPLLGPLPHLDLRGIDWVILGGESGPGARPLEEEWVVDIRDQCAAAGAPFFFKQWGGVQRTRAGRMLEGRLWEEMPEGAGVAETEGRRARGG